MIFRNYYLLLICSLPIVIISGVLGSVDRMKIEIQQFFDSGCSNIAGSGKKCVQLIQGRILGETKHSVIWKGIYSDRTDKNVEIAVKITTDQSCYDREMRIYEALNATTDSTIEQHGIPRVYYNGAFLRKYRVIAMTLFDGTLEDLYKKKGNISPDFSILLIFKQAVQVLSYLHTVGDLYILHNDIKPANIFLRGLRVFIGDFDYATLDWGQTIGHTPIYASRNFYSESNRYPMDDIESLIYSMWCVTGVPMVRTLKNDAESEGCVLSKCISKASVLEQMMEKCKHYKDSWNVRNAFEFICKEVVFGGYIIDYNKVIKNLDDEMSHLHGSKSATIHWL